MIWFLLALGAALGGAGMRLTNQHFKVSGFHLAVMVKAVLAVALLPYVLMVSWPSDPVFYWAIIATVPIILYTDRAVLNLCSEYGGGPVSRLEPMDNIAVFLVWTALNPWLMHYYLDQPLRFALICLSIFGSVIFAFKMRESRVSLDVLKALLPVIACSAAVSILNKTAMDVSIHENGPVIYIFFQGVFDGRGRFYLYGF